MGVEYTLRVDPPDPERILPLLRRLPDSTETDRGFDLGPFGGGWPAASAALDDEGVYFCDHGGGEAQIGLLVKWLAGEFGAVTVTEL